MFAPLLLGVGLGYVAPTSGGPSGPALLLESSGYLLLESGFYLLLE